MTHRLSLAIGALAAAVLVGGLTTATERRDRIGLDAPAPGMTLAPAPGTVDVHLGAARAAREPGPARHAGSVSLPAGYDSDWNNFGGNAQRNGRSAAGGPGTAELLWENDDDYSIIAWHPVILGSRVFAIRESGFPGAVANDVLVAYALSNGAELWRVVVPYAGDPGEEWIAYVAGADGARVYAARGGSGRTTPVYAFNVFDGGPVWASVHETVAGPQDGVVFAPNGDLIVGDFTSVARISAADGSTVWSTDRTCPVSGNCGCAISGDGVFIDSAAPGGNVIVKLDLDTGAYIYESEVMDGFTAQNAPFVSIDGGTVYFARTQNNPAVDFLYAFEDTGAALAESWRRPVRWTTSHEHGLADDGSIYTFLPGDEFARLDPATGDVLATAGTLGPIGTNLSARTAIGADGRVYVSNGWANDPATNGRIWAFSSNLDPLFTLTLNRQNSGGPSLGGDATLVVADRTSVRAYRAAVCPADLTGDGTVSIGDLLLLLADWGCVGDCAGDVDGDGTVGIEDLLALLAAWGDC